MTRKDKLTLLLKQADIKGNIIYYAGGGWHIVDGNQMTYIGPNYEKARCFITSNKAKSVKTLPNIDPNKLYLVNYGGTWLLGMFSRHWFGWNFIPNYGDVCLRIERLEEIYEMDFEKMKVSF